MEKGSMDVAGIFARFSYVAFDIGAELRNNLLEEPLLSPLRSSFAAPPIPDLPLARGPQRKHFLQHDALSSVPVPAQSPAFESLSMAGHAPSSSHLTKQVTKKSHLPTPSSGLIPPRLVAVSPAHSNSGVIPAGLAQPPLSPSTSGIVFYILYAPSIFSFKVHSMSGQLL